MSGVIFTCDAETKEEVLKKIQEALEKAEELGLYLVPPTVVQPVGDQWKGGFYARD